MVNFLIILVVAAIVGSALWYIRKEKKRGIQCIGCPNSATCGRNCSSCAGCGEKQM